MIVSVCLCVHVCECVCVCVRACFCVQYMYIFYVIWVFLLVRVSCFMTQFNVRMNAVHAVFLCCLLSCSFIQCSMLFAVKENLFFFLLRCFALGSRFYFYLAIVIIK